MRTFLYCDPDGDHYITDEQIIREYYPYWAGRMLSVGKILMATQENCIDDFCVGHWATEVTDEIHPDAP